MWAGGAHRRVPGWEGEGGAGLTCGGGGLSAPLAVPSWGGGGVLVGSASWEGRGHHAATRRGPAHLSQGVRKTTYTPHELLGGEPRLCGGVRVCAQVWVPRE